MNTSLLLIIITTAFVNNVVLSQFLGICSFLGVSKQMKASASLGGAKGSYCYYKAEYNDGIKTYMMNGRITIVASGNSLYQMRITAPRDWYSYYENVFRRARSTWKFR